RAVEGAAWREPDVAHRLEEVLGLNVLVARDLEARDGGPFLYDDDERVAVATELHVIEEAGAVHGAKCLLETLLVDAIADVDGQVVVHRALGDALQTDHAQVAHDEIALVLREDRACEAQGCKE